ncbi:hypothetical protein Tco_0776236 [Tanacetum coccineum]
MEDRSITKDKVRKEISKSRRKRSGHQEARSKSEYEEGLKDAYEDLNSPYKRPKPAPFTQRITRFKYHRRAKLPWNIRVYEEILEEFSQQKRYAKDPTKIHGIKRRQNEGLQAFMDRFKSESSHIKGVPPVLRISAFTHDHGHPELAKKLNDKIPKTVDEMFERVRAFIREEVVAGSAEIVCPSQGDKGYVCPAWPEMSKKARNRGGPREARSNIGVYTPYPRKDTFTPLDKTPKEIFAIESVSFPKPPPLIGTSKKQNLNKFCDYHGDRGRPTEQPAEWEPGKERQIRMAEDDKEKTVFHTEERVYYFTHMLKELKKSAATLQRMMEKDVKEMLRKLRRVNIKIDPTMSLFRVKEGKFLGHMVTEEGLSGKEGRLAKWATEIRTYDILYILRKEAEGFVMKKFFGQGEHVEGTPDANKGGIFTLSKKLQAKLTPTPRAWRLYVGKETIEEGSGVGIIRVSPEEKMNSYAIRLKFLASNHVIDYEALLAGLAAFTNQGMKDLHV